MAEKVEIEIGAKESAKAAFDRVAGYVKQQRKEQRQTGETALEQTLSSSRGLAGAAFDALGIGMQSMLVDRVGAGFKAATDKALEMRTQLKEGKGNAADMVNEMLKTLPLIGGMISGFENVRELIVDEQGELSEIAASELAFNETLKMRKSIMRANLEAAGEWSIKLSDINDQIKLLYAPPGAKGVVAAQLQFDNTLRDLRKQYEIDAKLLGPKGEELDEQGKPAGDLLKQKAKLEQLKIARDYAAATLRTRQADREDLIKHPERHPGYVPGLSYDVGEAPAEEELKKTTEAYSNQAAIVSDLRKNAEAREVDYNTARKAAIVKGLKEVADAQAEADKATAERMAQRRETELEGVKTRSEVVRDAERAASELRQKQMEEDGNAMGAQLERIQQNYKERIAGAQSVAEKESLQQSQVLDEQKARDEAEAAAARATTPSSRAAAVVKDENRGRRGWLDPTGSNTDAPVGSERGSPILKFLNPREPIGETQDTGGGALTGVMVDHLKQQTTLLTRILSHLQSPAESTARIFR